MNNAVPYHIIQPSTDNDVQIVSLDATMLILKCSLNINVPPGVVITWLHNGSVILTRTITQDTPVINSAMLLFGTLQPSDAGVYQCILNNPNNGWVLIRNIRLFITGMFVHMVLVTYNYMLDDFF